MDSAPKSSDDRVLVVLNHLCHMITESTSLSAILRTIAEAVQELAGARWGLFLILAAGRPPEVYGSEEALSLGPAVLQALQQTPLPQHNSSPMRLAIESPRSAIVPLSALVMPVIHGKRLRGALAALYEQVPDRPPDLILSLLVSKASIAMEKWWLNAVVSQSYANVIQALASAIDARDPSTHRHSQAVTELSVAMAEALGLSEEQVNRIRYAGILHDVGKIGIAEEILFKPGPLSPAERAVVEAHPLVGTSILAGIPYMEDLIPLIRHHHEHYDGSGYPDGLSGDDIPLGAQILAISDTFDAITTERSYHRGLNIAEACVLLQKEAGKSFAPDLVEAFVRMVRQRLEMPAQRE